MDRLKAHGEIPVFNRPVDLYLVGIGVGVPDRVLARNFVATWQLIAQATGAQLKSIDTNLRFP